ncbi:hypothetical protein PENTCL1PPCAC_1033 [Pristionchus entomophagus]|uniref:Uncharacterized protein n=1 Tax=Pristionchus entomophagus TaxID=358040 RepID=A0AAV5S859_9BILA|nr:hypothetical protein PENTCL1PPCAC_1033 [Pristionchus entomophagus]
MYEGEFRKEPTIMKMNRMGTARELMHRRLTKILMIEQFYDLGIKDNFSCLPTLCLLSVFKNLTRC